MGNLSNAAILVDGQGRPLAAQPGTALATGTLPQSSIVTSGSDYASAASAQVCKIDALGQQYAVPVNATGVPLSVGVNAAGVSTGNYGSISLAWDASTNYWRPFQVDATGASVVRNSLAATISYSPTTAINTTASAGKHMLSVFNASSTLYQRVLGFYAMCPPQSAVTGGLLSTSSTYTTVGMATYRFTTAHTGGTLVAGALHDTRDTYDANFTCRTGATVSGLAASSLYTFDAASSSTYGYGHREDVGVKVWTMAPGEGITFQCISAVGTGGVNFYLRLVCAQNVA